MYITQALSHLLPARWRLVAATLAASCCVTLALALAGTAPATASPSASPVIQPNTLPTTAGTVATESLQAESILKTPQCDITASGRVIITVTNNCPQDASIRLVWEYRWPLSGEVVDPTPPDCIKLAGGASTNRWKPPYTKDTVRIEWCP